MNCLWKQIISTWWICSEIIRLQRTSKGLDVMFSQEIGVMTFYWLRLSINQLLDADLVGRVFKNLNILIVTIVMIMILVMTIH